MTELPSWSGRALEGDSEQRQPERAPENDYRREGRSGLLTGLLIGLLIGLLLAGLSVGAFLLGRQQAEDNVAATDDSSESEDDAISSVVAEPEEDEAPAETADEADDAADGDAEDADGSGGDDAEGEAATDEADGSDGQLLLPADFEPSDPNYETRIALAPEYAVVRGGKVYLYGFARTQEDLDTSIAITEAVMGPDGYVVERFVDPDAPEVEGAPIFVDDKVLFGFNSTDLDAGSLPILDLGVALMLQNPTAEMLIIARSDAIGDSETNLEVSRRRGDAVVEYWVSQGVERSRMTVEARGEADASEDDSPEDAALNRSVEFVVSNIVDG